MLFCKRLNLTHLKRSHRADINSYLRKSSIIGENSFARGISIKLADIGEGIHEVELLKWFVNEGTIHHLCCNLYTIMFLTN